MVYFYMFISGNSSYIRNLYKSWTNYKIVIDKPINKKIKNHPFNKD